MADLVTEVDGIRKCEHERINEIRVVFTDSGPSLLAGIQFDMTLTGVGEPQTVKGLRQVGPIDGSALESVLGAIDVLRSIVLPGCK